MTEEKKVNWKKRIMYVLLAIVLVLAIGSAFHFGIESLRESARLKYKAVITLEVPSQYSECTHVSMEWSTKSLLWFAPLNSTSFSCEYRMTQKKVIVRIWVAYYQEMGEGSFVRLGLHEHEMHLLGTPLEGEQ